MHYIHQLFVAGQGLFMKNKNAPEYSGAYQTLYSSAFLPIFYQLSDIRQLFGGDILPAQQRPEKAYDLWFVAVGKDRCGKVLLTA